MGKVERAEHLIEPASEGARGPLHVQTKAGVAHLMGGGKR